MKKFFLGILTSAIAGLFIYYIPIFFERSNTAINIKTISEILLTDVHSIDGLNVKYTYHDSIEVNNLWKSTFLIENVGNTIIYGKGDKKNILNDHINLLIDSCNMLLSVDIDNQNIAATLKNKKNLTVLQWKPKEFIEISLLTEGINPPILRISDRIIENCSITYSKYNSGELKENKNKVIKWISLANSIIAVIVSIGLLLSQYKAYGKRFYVTRNKNNIL